MICAVGTYTGNADATKAITGLGFQPDAVIIKAIASQYGVWLSSTMTADDTAYFANAAANFAGGIASLDADGFTVGNHATVNGNGIVFYWQAFKDNGQGEIHIGTYTGDGNDDRGITGCGFQPDIVWIKRDGASDGALKTSSVAGEPTLRFSGTADDATNFIQALQADGFQVGTDNAVNANGGAYHYVAFKATAGWIKNGTYTGNAADNRDISGVGFVPDLVWVKTSGAWALVTHPSSLAGDNSYYFINVGGPYSDRIQALQADGFQVGTAAVVNSGGVAEYYFAWKAGRNTAHTMALADGIGVNASLSMLAGYQAALSDGLGVGESVLGSAGRQMPLADGLTISDSLDCRAGYRTGLADGLQVVESLAILAARQMDLSDALGVGEALELLAGRTMGLADGLAVADTLAWLAGYRMAVDDTLALLESLGLVESGHGSTVKWWWTSRINSLFHDT